MVFRISGLVVAAACLLPTSALAHDLGFFAGIDVSGGAAFGSSDTTNGGDPRGGGGVVGNVKFGPAVGIGGHVGYRFDPAMAGYVSYEHATGDVSWDADFPLIAEASHFAGTASSDILLGNLAYEFVLSGTTTVAMSAGAGVSFNTLSGVVETDKATGIAFSSVADHTEVSPAARLGAGVERRLGSGLTLGLAASVSYVGGFETGNSRVVSGAGTSSINPYGIDNVWRTDLTASLRKAF